MGNSLRVVLDNYIGSVPFPCHLQLGPSTSIDLSRNYEAPEDGVVKEKWNMTYTIDEKTCLVELGRYDDFRPGYVELLTHVTYSFTDSLSGRTGGIIQIVITKTNFVRTSPPLLRCSTDSLLWTKKNTSFDACGGVIAVESKRNKKEEDPEVVTVAHYIVKSSGTSFYRSTEIDIGLSVVAKFRASNGKFQITVEGPEQHPVSALLYMFDEVNRTGIWKPTMCPHCDHKRRGTLFWQSDSEDSDSVSMPLPLPLPRATPRNARGVSNGGRFLGNGNGNIYENNVMVFKRR